MVVSLLFSGGVGTSTPSSVHTVGSYPATNYGTNPLVVQVVAGLATTPNGGSLVESGRWGPDVIILGPRYRNSGSPADAHVVGGNATDFLSLNASTEDENHAGYLNSGGDAIFTGDAAAELAVTTFILHIDDVVLDGPPPSVNGHSFSGSTGAIVGCFPNPATTFGSGESWSFHSISGVINDTIPFFPVLENLAREVYPFAFAVIFGHSNDSPSYGTPDMVNGLPSWSMIGFHQINHYFSAVALWVPPDPSSPDYAFSFSGFPTSDWGSIAIYTLNFPAQVQSRSFGTVIG